MLAIRIAKAQRAKAWRLMIEVAPVRLVATDPIYVVCPAHLDLLSAQGIPYEVLPLFSLKGWNKPAQGNALGSRTEEKGSSPERA
jgi:hypothetical protein